LFRKTPPLQRRKGFDLDWGIKIKRAISSPSVGDAVGTASDCFNWSKVFFGSIGDGEEILILIESRSRGSSI
jgi:hypothetical protein